MATLVNGQVNGHAFSDPKASVNKRFSDIPIAIEVPVGGEDVEEAVEVNLEELLDDPTELCELLEYENASKNLWMTIALAYAKQHMVDHAIDIVKRGLQALTSAPGKEKIGLLSSLCWLYLWKSREAPRVVPEGELVSEAKTKDSYLQDATGALNEASRVNPSFPPLFLARGILSLLRASLQPPSKPLAPGSIERSERIETLKQALKCFEDASRVSAGRNMMAQLGKARTLFSLARYAESLECYQDVLAKMPDLRDPDPRIGIGCCLWQLTHVEEAREAWERALELASTHQPLQHPYANDSPRIQIRRLQTFSSHSTTSRAARILTSWIQNSFNVTKLPWPSILNKLTNWTRAMLLPVPLLADISYPVRPGMKSKDLHAKPLR